LVRRRTVNLEEDGTGKKTTTQRIHPLNEKNDPKKEAHEHVEELDSFEREVRRVDSMHSSMKRRNTAV